MAAALMLGYLVVPPLALLHALPETNGASLSDPDTLDVLRVSLIDAGGVMAIYRAVRAIPGAGTAALGGVSR